MDFFSAYWYVDAFIFDILALHIKQFSILLKTTWNENKIVPLPWVQVFKLLLRYASVSKIKALNEIEQTRDGYFQITVSCQGEFFS